MELNQLTPRQALIYDALIPPGMPVRGKELARRTRISERDLRSERKAMQEQGVPIVSATGRHTVTGWPLLLMSRSAQRSLQRLAFPRAPAKGARWR